MNRAAAATLACLALAAVLTLAPESGWLDRGDARAQAAECAWHRHSKRIVKHVKRGARKRRLIRTAHWWTCDPLPPSAAPAPPPAAGPAPQPAPEAEPESNRLGVKSVEYSYTLSRPSVSAGEVTVELDNQGEDAHNLNLQREGGEEAPLQVPETASEEHRAVHFDLPPGTYKLWCSLPTHEEQGMHTTLVVVG